MLQCITLFEFWGQSGCILDKTQTFVGVLATLIVLCLIKDRTNFIFSLVQTIHLESDILRRTNDLNKSIKEGVTLSELIERITRKKVKVQSLPHGIHNDLLTEWNQVEIQPNIFNNYAEERNKAYKGKYDEIKDRKEGLLNARFSFAILLIIMLVDCWPINEKISCLFLLFFLILYVDFTLVLWTKYIVGKSARKHVYFTKTRGLLMSFGMLIVSFLISLVGIASNSFTQMGVKFPFALSFIIAFALMVHYKVCGIDNSDKYNNGWIAKHALYITFSSAMLALCTILIAEWVDRMGVNSYPFHRFNANVNALSANLGMMRTVFVSYVAINTFFIEVLVCYAYNIWFKFYNLHLINEKYEECKKEKKIHMRNCKMIIYNIMDNELKGERISPKMEYLKRITIGRHDFIFNLKWYKWG